ncbi:MAG: outer membrane beta-barrel protein [Rickettsiales bacterium]|nr:outer membrane beta-barrel protein [Rickettsiales bacterium]
MKKLFAISLLAASFVSNAALAKTEGSYVGIDLLNTKVKFYERYTNSTTPTATDRKPSFSHSDYGFGLHYNYALNANGLFVAPGVFWELNNSTVNGHGDTQDLQRLKIKNRYGLKLDVGGDITNVIAPYLTGGYVAIHHNGREYFSGNNTRSRSSTSMEWFYGAGVKFNCDKETAVSIEYTTQSFDVRNFVDGNTVNLDSRFRTRMDVLKFGVSYRF